MIQRSRQDPAVLILENATDFLNVGLDLLFSADAASRQGKAGVMAIQTAIELLAKYRLVRAHGFASILRGSPPTGNLLTAAARGSFRTKGYGECLKMIREDETFTPEEVALLDSVQNLRNSLVHFAATLDIDEVRMQVAWVLIRALGMFAAGQDRDHGEMQTYAQFLDKANFARLTNFGPYRAEAVDSANDSLDSEDVLRCWECLEDALSVRPSETYFCHCCGLTANLEVASFSDCSHCREKSAVCYDPLNETGGVHHGRCLHCLKFVGVVVCADCDNVWAQSPDMPAQSCEECKAL